jgi:hypothetical protein
MKKKKKKILSTHFSFIHVGRFVGATGSHVAGPEKKWGKRNTLKVTVDENMPRNPRTPKNNIHG